MTVKSYGSFLLPIRSRISLRFRRAACSSPQAVADVVTIPPGGQNPALRTVIAGAYFYSTRVPPAILILQRPIEETYEEPRTGNWPAYYSSPRYQRIPKGPVSEN